MNNPPLASAFRVTSGTPAPKTATPVQAKAPVAPTKAPRSRAKVNVVSHSEASKGYRYEDKDPDMYAILYLMDQSEHTDAWFEQQTGLTRNTLYNWRMGRTKRPSPSSKRIILKVLNVTRRYFIGDQEIVIPGYLQMEQTLADLIIGQKMMHNKS